MIKKIQLMKSVGCVCFLVFFVMMVYLSSTGRNVERFGTFSDAAKVQIDLAFKDVCTGLGDVAKCASVSWGGKHKWFGRMTFEVLPSRPSTSHLIKVVEGMGWSSAGPSSAGVSEYFREELEISFYSVNGVIQEMTITTKR
jgi:hypothetical protein